MPDHSTPLSFVLGRIKIRHLIEHMRNLGNDPEAVSKNEFSLGVLDLVVQAPDDILLGIRMVVLNRMAQQCQVRQTCAGCNSSASIDPSETPVPREPASAQQRNPRQLASSSRSLFVSFGSASQPPRCGGGMLARWPSQNVVIGLFNRPGDFGPSILALDSLAPPACGLTA